MAIGTYEHDAADFQDRSRSDARALVRFFIRPVQNEKKSAEAGRPIFEDKEYCEVVVPGSKSNRPVKPVNDIIKRRYAAQYRQWKSTGEGDFTTEGTPLTEVTWITRSQVEELAYQRIRTLEQLADISDQVCSRQAGLYDLRRKAKEFLDAANAAAPLAKMQAELVERDQKISLLERTLAEQAEMIKKLQDQMEE